MQQQIVDVWVEIIIRNKNGSVLDSTNSDNSKQDNRIGQMKIKKTIYALVHKNDQQCERKPNAEWVYYPLTSRRAALLVKPV